MGSAWGVCCSKIFALLQNTIKSWVTLHAFLCARTVRGQSTRTPSSEEKAKMIYPLTHCPRRRRPTRGGAMSDTRLPLKGRGTAENPPNRFERLAYTPGPTAQDAAEDC